MKKMEVFSIAIEKYAVALLQRSKILVAKN